MNPVPFLKQGKRANMHTAKKNAIITCYFIILSCFFISVPSFSTARAQTALSMGDELTDGELGEITAQTGLSINYDVTMDVSYDNIAWGDSDGYPGSSDRGWIGFNNYRIENFHIWPRTDYSMNTSNWSQLEMLTLDVITLDDPETMTDPGELAGLDHITKLRIGIPTISLSFNLRNTELLLGADDRTNTIGGQIDGTYVNGIDLTSPDLSQKLAEFEINGFYLYTDGGGEILIGPHGSDSTLVPGLTGSGISIAANNTRMHIDVEEIGITDTDNGNKIVFQDFTIDDGAGGYFSFDTLADTPNTFDVGSDLSGWTVVRLGLSHNTQPRTYTADHFIFCDQDIGSLAFNGVREGPAELLFAAHRDGTCGIDFEYNTTLNIDSVDYTYNTTPDYLAFNGIHAAEFAAGSPEDPTSWGFSGRFRVGDLDGTEIDVDSDPNNPAVPNPATIDIGTDPGTGYTSLAISAPMKGTIRVEDVKFGGTDFGPCAIDGITVHRLDLTFSAN
jgi:hypothetical protein